MCEPAPHAHLQQVAHFGPSCNHSWAALFLWCSVCHVWDVCMCICRSCVGPCLSSALFVLWLELEQSLYGTNVFISHVCDVSVACWWSVTATCLWVSNLNGWACRRCIPFWMSTCQDCVQTSELMFVCWCHSPVVVVITQCLHTVCVLCMYWSLDHLWGQPQWYVVVSYTINTSQNAAVFSYTVCNIGV